MPKILIVEDNPDIVELIQMILKPYHCETFVDYHGFEAVSICKTKKPDLVILDIALPGVDGYTIQHELLADEHTHQIPILIITSKHQLHEIFVGANNVMGFMEKPLHIGDFRRKVINILQSKGFQL
jgi:DNA-binding response OmpR family regulator